MNPNRRERSSNLSIISDVAVIERIIAVLWTQLYAMDAVVEQLSPGFVEDNLRNFSHATGQFGLINTAGELIECTPDGRPIAIPQDAHNRSEQLAEQPARSLDDVRAVVATELRRSVLQGLHPTDATTRARDVLKNIRTLLKQLEVETGPNISHEWIRRLRKLAAIEAEALEAYLKSP